MNFLTRLNIGPRLGIGFAFVLALTVVVGAFSVTRLARVNDATRDLATNWLVAMRALGEYEGSIAAVRRSEALFVMNDRPEQFGADARQAELSKTKAAEAWKNYAATITPGEEEKLANGIVAAQASYYESLSKTLAMNHSEAGFAGASKTHFETGSRAAFESVIKALDDDVALQTKGGEAAYKNAEESYKGTQITVISLIAAAVAIGASLALMITRSITKPIARAVVVAEMVASGDLTSEVHVGSTDETGQLLAALKKMNESLLSVVGQVRNSSDSIATGSAQIATGNLDLSQRTEEQASNLQQTAASMEQLTATVKQNSDTARQATQLAGGASEAAAEGGRVVGKVVSTMDNISQSSRKIADIIGVIDGIAFQTNILALNAAVEAARAGEQGRGFAVVASEVRSLAQRSAQAAKEIKKLISESVEEVESGSRLVDEAGKSMTNIVERVKRVNDLIGEISSASQEQSTGIGQIGDAVNQLDQVTQQNAALVEESAAAADSLKHQAAQLAQTASIFKVSPSHEAGRTQEAGMQLGALHSQVRAAKPVARPRTNVASVRPLTSHARGGVLSTSTPIKTVVTADADEWVAF